MHPTSKHREYVRFPAIFVMGDAIDLNQTFKKHYCGGVTQGYGPNAPVAICGERILARWVAFHVDTLLRSLCTAGIVYHVSLHGPADLESPSPGKSSHISLECHSREPSMRLSLLRFWESKEVTSVLESRGIAIHSIKPSD